MTFTQNIMSMFACIGAAIAPNATQSPYVYTIKNAQQMLVYIGTSHSYDPQHPQYKTLKEQWETFVHKRNGTKNLVIERSEEEKLPALLNQPDTVIIQEGADTNLINQWGLQCAIPIVGADISQKEQTQLLLKKYKKEIVYYWAFAYLTEMWGRNKSNDYESFVMGHLRNFTGDYSVTLEEMKTLHTKFFNTPFNKHDSEFFYSITTSTESHGIFNELSKYTMKLRDQKVIDTIKKLWKEGKNIFVVFGAVHAYNQEKQLRKALT